MNLTETGYASYTNSELADAYRDTSKALTEYSTDEDAHHSLQAIHEEIELRGHPTSQGPSRAYVAGKQHHASVGYRESPLSGEWSGESIPELSEVYQINLTSDWNADAFEEGFTEASEFECVDCASHMGDF